MKKYYTKQDEIFLNAAIELARENVLGGGGPFGAIVVHNDSILSTGVNLVTRHHDPTAHAEIIAIRRACESLSSFTLTGCTIYSSCEPCPMCLGAIYWARLDQLFFASSRHDADQAGFGDAAFYEELCKHHQDRKIPTIKVEIPSKGTEFKAWLEKEDRQEY